MTAFYDLCICPLGNAKLARESDMNRKVKRKAATGWPVLNVAFIVRIT